jgi:cation diffusion facilitator family transporter
MTSLAVSAIVLYAGISALIESITKIIHPEAPSYDTITIAILVVAIIVKFALGFFVKNTGQKIHSDSLIASGIDARNDAILSISVLASAIIYLIWQIDLEAYVGVLVSLFIIKTGIELVKESANNILGTRIESDLSRKIKRQIEKDPDVQGAFDLILTDYGPGKYLGSVHIEVKDTLTVAELDQISRRITKTIHEKFGVILHYRRLLRQHQRPNHRQNSTQHPRHRFLPPRRPRNAWLLPRLQNQNHQLRHHPRFRPKKTRIHLPTHLRRNPIQIPKL